jgi:DNA-binding winged helix-turn-helix (wHTH) protein
MTFRFECYTIDPARRELRRSGDLIHLEPQVFDVLVYLVEHRDRVVSKDELFANVWHGRIVSETTLSSRVNAARRAIGDTGSRQGLIQTISRRGFRFIGEATKQAAASEKVANTKRAANAEPSAGKTVEKPSMAEGLINSLSYIRWLTVIARNPSFVYKATGIDVRQIARELSVRYLLEGSVHKAGRVVRITAQLTDAESGTYRWSDKFDGPRRACGRSQDQSLIGRTRPRCAGYGTTPPNHALPHTGGRLPTPSATALAPVFFLLADTSMRGEALRE